MAPKKPDLEKMKELVCKLPGVLGAQLKQDASGELCDIHVLSDLSRAPKQTVRDVQAALSAGYGLELDHKIISVAQIPAELAKKERPMPRVRYTGLDVCCTADACSVNVHLRGGGRDFSGAAVSALDRLSRYRAAAQATVEALNDYMGARAQLRFGEVRLTEMPGATAVVCSVAFTGRERAEVLVGSCIDRDDGGVSAVRAALDAVNRRLVLSV